jgi:hypothetical protein
MSRSAPTPFPGTLGVLFLHPPLLLSLLLLAACADGGKEVRPQSDVKVTAVHHLYSFRTLRGFGNFPPTGAVAFTDRGKLNLFDDSLYTIERPTGTSGSDRYAIANDGALSIYVTGAGNEPSVIFRGAYSLNTAPGTTQSDFFFTDRVTTNASPSIGLWYGTRVKPGQIELEGAWHLLSLHAIFGQSLPSPENVGRGAHGAVTVAAGAPGTLRTLSGTGTQGSSSLTFGGSIQNLLDGSSNGDGTCNLTVSYQVGGSTPDNRVMLAAGHENIVFGLDADESDGEAGLVLLVRKFDGSGSPVDSSRVPGTFFVGGHTLFVNPNNAGGDTFVGVVTLTSQGGFRLEAVGNNGQDFVYSGSFTLAADGGMTITIPGTSETWYGAIDRTYNSFAFVDGFVESRSNNTPELNFAFGVRRKAP